jgi:hypothetical protein
MNPRRLGNPAHRAASRYDASLLAMRRRPRPLGFCSPISVESRQLSNTGEVAADDKVHQGKHGAEGRGVSTCASATDGSRFAGGGGGAQRSQGRNDLGIQGVRQRLIRQHAHGAPHTAQTKQALNVRSQALLL